MNRSSNILLISGPSGIGKDFLANSLVAEGKHKKILMTTTREIRTGEKDGIDYEFLNIDQYHKVQQIGDFFMDNEFFGNSYSIRTSAVDTVIREGKTAIGIIYTPKIPQFLSQYPNAYTVFLYPDNFDLWTGNLISRDGNIKRLEYAYEELKLWELKYRQFYKKVYKIKSHDFSEILGELQDIIKEDREVKIRNL